MREIKVSGCHNTMFVQIRSRNNSMDSDETFRDQSKYLELELFVVFIYLRGWVVISKFDGRSRGGKVVVNI